MTDTGGSIEAPLGLSLSPYLLYTAGPGAPDNTAGALSSPLPTSWTGPAGVEHGQDTGYRQEVEAHQDMCREDQPRGRLCAASRRVAKGGLTKTATEFFLLENSKVSFYL